MFDPPGTCQRCGTPKGMCGSWTSSGKFIQTERCSYTELLTKRLAEAEGIIAAFLHGDIDQEGWELALDFLKGEGIRCQVVY